MKEMVGHDHVFRWNLQLALLQVEPCASLGMEVDFSMAYAAKGDEIFFHIPSELAALLHRMNLQICRTPASLASPATALERLPAKQLIGIPVQAKPGLSWDWWIHEAFGIRSKNSWR